MPNNLADRALATFLRKCSMHADPRTSAIHKSITIPAVCSVALPKFEISAFTADNKTRIHKSEQRHIIKLNAWWIKQ